MDDDRRSARTDDDEDLWQLREQHGARAGLEVDEAGLTHLAYASEIAGAMRGTVLIDGVVHDRASAVSEETPLVHVAAGRVRVRNVMAELGDANNDGNLDLAIGYTSGELEIWLGAGTGHFTFAAQYNPKRPWACCDRPVASRFAAASEVYALIEAAGAAGSLRRVIPRGPSADG